VLEQLTHHCATIKIELVDKIQQDHYGELQAVVSKELGDSAKVTHPIIVEAETHEPRS
jgi:hypothetical protein